MLYPNNIKKESKKETINYANRGMELESLLNETNDYYNEKDIALIYKKPTPIGISKAIYTKKGRVIKNGFFKAQSTLDYNGIYKGKYIDFEAKESRSLTAFPFSSIHPHQVKHLSACLRHGAIAFIILRMVLLNETYLIKAEDFVDYYYTTKRKSLPYDWIKTNGHLIDYKYMIPCDYLKTVDKVYELEGK